jgi:hypothetical protein
MRGVDETWVVGYEDIIFDESKWEKVKRVDVNCQGT